MSREIAIFDLDGTLALIEHRRHLVTNGNNKWDEFYLACDKDEPNEPVITTARCLWQNAIGIVIFSGRGEIARAKTEKWLLDHDVYYDELIMRPVDDYTPDDELKKQWLGKYDKEKIFCVFDDRNKVVDMWRKEGLACFQVAEGNF